MFIPFVLKNANDFGHLFFIISIFFLLILGAPASAELPEKHRPALQLEYYLDSTHRLNMDRILQSQHHEDIDAEPIIWQKTKQTTLSLAQTQSTLWVKMTLFPQKISPHQKHYLVVHQSLIETLNLFYYGKNQKAFSFFAGNKLNNSHQIFAHPHLYFPLEIEIQTPQTLYLQAQSNYAFFLPFSIQNEQTLSQQGNTDFFILGISLGLMLFFMLFALVFLRHSRSIFFISTGWCFVQFLSFLSTNLLENSLIWPLSSLNMYTAHSWYFLNIIPSVFILFERFNIRDSHSTLSKIFSIVCAFVSFYTLMCLFLPHAAIFKPINALLLLFFFGLIFLPLYFSKKGNRQEAIYITLLILCAFHLNFLNILHLNNFMPLSLYKFFNHLILSLNFTFYWLFIGILFVWIFIHKKNDGKKSMLEREETQKNLVLSNRHLSFYNEMKDRFLEKVGQDLLVPIEKLELEMNALALTPMKSHEQEWQEECWQNISHIKNTIYEIYHYSQLQTGSLKPIPQSFSLEKLVCMLHKNYHPIFHHHKVGFQIEIADNVPKNLVGDAQIILQILNHLLDNAAKFTQKGSVKVLIQKRENEKNVSDPYILFSVIDSGIGMEKEKINHLFDTFIDKDFMSLARTQGIGIGLSTSLHLAKLMRGDIEVKSTPNQGSVFTLLLHLSEAEHHINPIASAEAKISQLNAQKKSPAQKKITGVLPSIHAYYETELDLKLIKNLIIDQQVQLLITNDFDELTKNIDEKTPDIIIIDVSKNAIQAVKWLQTQNKILDFSSLKIVILTHIKDARFRDKCLEFGVKEVYVKPVDKKEILTLLSK